MDTSSNRRPMARPRLDLAADGQISAVGSLVHRVLGAAAVAGYLFGSSVRGGLRPESDLDLLVVAERHLTPGERRAIIDGLLGISRSRDSAADVRHLEVTVVVHADVRPWRYPPPLELQYGDWWRREFEAGTVAPWTSPAPDLAIVLTTVRAEGVPLFGPPATEILDAVPADDLARALRDVIPDLLADLDHDTRNVLLTLARIWLSLETGRIEPKDVAATWVLEQLPQPRGEALRRARDGYLGELADDWSDPTSLAAAREVAETMLRAIKNA